MIQACKNCHQQFDNTKQRSDCPHREFPVECKIHQRMNCGNHECNRANISEIKREEREDKYGTR